MESRYALKLRQRACFTLACIALAAGSRTAGVCNGAVCVELASMGGTRRLAHLCASEPCMNAGLNCVRSVPAFLGDWELGSSVWLCEACIPLRRVACTVLVCLSSSASDGFGSLLCVSSASLSFLVVSRREARLLTCVGGCRHRHVKIDDFKTLNKQQGLHRSSMGLSL
jgi:hypothetical protein